MTPKAQKLLALFATLSTAGSGAAFYVVRAEVKAQVHEVEQRTVKLETILPEVRDDLKEVKEDVKDIKYIIYRDRFYRDSTQGGE